MTERKQFENWASMPPREWDTTRWPDDDRYSPWPNCYVKYEVQCAWESWQARGDADSNQAVWEGNHAASRD